MLRRLLIVSFAGVAGVLFTAADVQAWGAAHVGYTHVGPSGVYHYGRNAAVGPYGAYSGAHVSHYGGYGYDGTAYRAGYAANPYPYGVGGYGAYGYGGYRVGGYADPYVGGVYRRW